ncbi:MAG TPA: VOC family protein [Melioribacteraceae bacterium]|nr:VOC family protein [Melioribacteraceae bacterium]
MPKIIKIVISIGLALFLVWLIKTYLINDEKEMYDDSFDRMLESVATVLPVDNVNESVEFYKRYFGFTLYSIFPDEGEATLAVVERKKLYVMFQDRKVFKEENKKYIGGEIDPSFTLLIDIDNAYELYDSLKTKLEVVQELQLMFYGQLEFSVRDLDGYIITFSQDIGN